MVEPNASPISERLSALRKAHDMGLRTYGMLCPLLPGISDAPTAVDELVRVLQETSAQSSSSPRQSTLEARAWRSPRTPYVLPGLLAEAEAVHRVRHKEDWSEYVVRLITAVQRAATAAQHALDKMRFLLYSAEA